MNRSPNVVLVLPALLLLASVLVGIVVTSTPDDPLDSRIAALTVEPQHGFSDSPVHSPTSTSSSTRLQETSPTPTPPCTPTAYDPEPCESRDVSKFSLFSRSTGYPASSPEEASSVEAVLEKGWEEAGGSPVHVAVRATMRPDTVRCDWRGVARTQAQREMAVRFWLEMNESDSLPSAEEVERRFMAEIEGINAAFPWTARSDFRTIARGGLSTDQRFLTCYVDYNVLEYLVSEGPSVITVA